MPAQFVINSLFDFFPSKYVVVCWRRFDQQCLEIISSNNLLKYQLREPVKVENKKKVWHLSHFFYVGGGGQRSLSHFLFYAWNGLIRPEMQRKFVRFLGGVPSSEQNLWKFSKYFDFFQGKKWVFPKLLRMMPEA